MCRDRHNDESAVTVLSLSQEDQDIEASCFNESPLYSQLLIRTITSKEPLYGIKRKELIVTK
jgi:hypothetical protein